MEIEVDPHIGACIMIVDTTQQVASLLPDVEQTSIIMNLLNIHISIMEDYIRNRHFGTHNLEDVFDKCVEIQKVYKEIKS